MQYREQLLQQQQYANDSEEYDEQDLITLITRENGQLVVVTYGFGVPRLLENYVPNLTQEQYHKLSIHGWVYI